MILQGDSVPWFYTVILQGDSALDSAQWLFTVTLHGLVRICWVLTTLYELHEVPCGENNVIKCDLYDPYQTI